MAKRDHRERRETHAAAIAAAVPDQMPTVERRAPLLLACAGTEMPRLFRDDVLCGCSECGASIYHRPWALAELGPGARAACLPCAAHHEEQQASLTPLASRLSPATAGITRRTLDEALRYMAEHWH